MKFTLITIASIGLIATTCSAGPVLEKRTVGVGVGVGGGVGVDVGVGGHYTGARVGGYVAGGVYHPRVATNSYSNNHGSASSDSYGSSNNYEASHSCSSGSSNSCSSEQCS